MTDQQPAEERRLTEAERRRRRADVFGDVLPDATADERGDAGSEPDAGPDAGPDAADDWLRRQVPPHHG